MVTERQPRLPGVAVAVQAPQLDETLPRMDIALFVGFAASGPFHTPTVVEDLNEFTRIFGADLPLARDAGRGEVVYAYLGSAVRAFFRNGGRRCWIIRAPIPVGQMSLADVFLDADLKTVGTERLLAEADFIRYQSSAARSLTGVHRLLDVEEITLVAVPDAVHRSWRPTTPPPPQPPIPSPPLQRPAWWHFLGCPLPANLPRVSEPEWGNFLDCDVRVIAPPVLTASEADPVTCTFTLQWESSPPQMAGRYLLEEATTPDFREAIVLHSGPQTRRTLYGRAPGDYYYRVRVEVDSNFSDWSNGVVVRVSAIPPQELNSTQQYSNRALLAIHRALLRLCAARGDVFALLTLPEHYREQDAMSHAALLRAKLGEAPATEDVPPFGYGETVVLSYGAVYHPWLVSRDEAQTNALRRTPPCGAMSGVLAQRALRRGAWIAPANEPLQGVLALEPRIAQRHYLPLQEARMNLIRQEPRGFLVLDADTLSEDDALRPINVRRLLSLLRRLALRLGATYVFEPNDPPFRRAVKRGFEALLEQMFIRGAFAGATTATSYQVAVDDTINPPAGVEQGRFIVELRVAPSLPMTFLTIRLVQTGDRNLVTEG
jgi:hypothetical protein